MPLLKLRPEATFWAVVPIPVPGKGTVDVKFEFKHRTKDELAEFNKGAEDRSDVDHILETVAAWELADKFDKENVAVLLQTYHGAAYAIAAVYLRELTGARKGN